MIINLVIVFNPHLAGGNMANSNLLHCLMIISIASFVSSISSHLQHQSPPKKLLYDMLGIESFDDKAINGNEYQFVRSYNPEDFSQKSFGVEDRNFDANERPENRMARYLGDNNIVCEVSITKGIFLQQGYEFYPSEYINKTCIYSNSDPFTIESNGKKSEVCLHNDNEFGCQTLYEELNVLKRSTKGKHECWEHMTQLVAVGCKCNIRFKY